MVSTAVFPAQMHAGKESETPPSGNAQVRQGDHYENIPITSIPPWEIARAKMARESSSIPGKLRIVHNQTLRVC